MPDRVPHAVFLSYAHEDAPAARRLADSLRAAGVEVWFDQSELRGGDAWDQKIRQQIKTCALFVPLVSAHTEARSEGYFRLEWKLAEERTALIAKGVPFLLPVAIDDITEDDAMVPDGFRAVQWMRLPVGESTAALVAQVQRLLVAPRRTTRAAAVAGGARPEPASSRPLAKFRRPRLALAGVVAACVVLFFTTRKPEPAAAAPNSIAVLPFQHESPDAADAFFTDGVHEDILTSLFNIRDVDVRPRTSVEQYRGAKKTLKQISAELRVAYVLEGSVRRMGNKVRVTARLSDTRTDRQAWAKSYDEELSDIFAIQAELAKAIAGELRAVISPQVAKLLAARPTDNPLAYDKYLQARAAKHQREPDANNKALALVNEAVVLDPKFALGWAWLAFHYGQEYLVNSNSPGDLAKANAAIEAAMRLAPDEPEVVLNRGFHYYNQRDYARAMEYFEQFGQLRPNSAVRYWAFAMLQRRQNKWVEAMANLRRATQLEPGNTDYGNLLAELLLAGRRYPEAIAEYSRLAALPDNRLEYEFIAARIHFLMHGSTENVEAFFSRLTPEQMNAMRSQRRSWNIMTGKSGAGGLSSNEALVLLAPKGDHAEVQSRSEDRTIRLRQELLAGPENARNWGRLARLEALRGNREEALRCAGKAVALLPESRDYLAGPRLLADRAFVYTWVGDKERAITEYAHLLRQPLQTSFIVENVHVMRVHPQFAPLRGDLRFEALLNDAKNNAPLF